MGTHPVAPSFAVPPDGLRPLPDLVRGSPEAGEGGGAGDGCQGGLPFLVKLLAASAPLSLLVHPSTAQTEVRYAREEAAGIPRDGSAPCYRDRSHKPEMFPALTRFDLPCGSRPPRDVAAQLTALGVAGLAEVVDRPPGKLPARPGPRRSSRRPVTSSSRLRSATPTTSGSSR